MNISDYLARIEELTNTNLKLLKALNDSFYTDENHLSVNMGEVGTVAIPSFISLENKINLLQNNFENLVNSPTTSDAYFNFDGNSRAIQVKGYEQSPSPLVLGVPSNFYVEDNNTLRDFLTPSPYVKFDVSELPNDITEVCIRKVVPVTSTAISRFTSMLGSESRISKSWGDINKALDDLTAGTDYILYDTVKTLPLRKGQGSGSYVIKHIVNNWVDENLDQHVTLQFANDIEGYQKTLSYLLFDQTIERYLSEGQHLVAWDGHVKFEIESLNFNTNTITMRVMFGDFLNLSEYVSGPVDDSAKLKFFSESELFEDDKYVKVTLEEDKYVFVAIAPINPRMNIRASWGDGVLMDVDSLTNNDESFRQYYNENCVNIGDILNEISKVMSNTVSSHTDEDLNNYISAVPTIDTNILKVVHINKHLDESPTIQTIRALYAQKNNYNADLAETQNSITSLEEQLAKVDFQDTTGLRTRIQSNIDSLSAHKNEVINSLMKITNEISLAANNSVVPIENAKYRIRGFFDFEEFASTIGISQERVKGIYVQYRYRNVQQESGTAQTFVKDSNGNGVIDEEDKTFIFSDWNVFTTPLRPRVRNTNGTYSAQPDNSNKNEPSFNQIDIPITQGENVDVRLKVIYDLGYPFIQITSDWSPISTFVFPEEFMKDVQILDIINENNDDIETNRFKSILINDGVTAHISDKIMDQDSVYFHKPNSISSGFYTAERRVIPLYDKLQTMDNDIKLILDELNGTTSDLISVNFEFDESSISLNPFEKGNVILQEFSSFADISAGNFAGNYLVNTKGTQKYASLQCSIRLVNTSSRTLKIFSMFPGTDDVELSTLHTWAFHPSHYSGIVYYDYEKYDVDHPTNAWKLQTTNQIITYRNDDPYDNTQYYSESVTPKIDENNQLCKCTITTSGADNVITPEWYCIGSSTLGNINKGMFVYPASYRGQGLKMTNKEAYKYMIINPGQELVFPVVVEYFINNVNNENSQIEKTIAFDIRTSLYNDPLHYAVKIGAAYTSTPQDKIVNSVNEKPQTYGVRTNVYNTFAQ